MTAFTQEFIKELNEEQSSDKTKLSLLFIVRMLGEKECLARLEQAKKDFERGTVIHDGSRQRTLGGCFFMRIPNDVNALARKKARDLYKAINSVEKP